MQSGIHAWASKDSAWILPVISGRGELGDSLGSLGDSVLRQLARQDQTHSGLDLTRGNSGFLHGKGMGACMTGGGVNLAADAKASIQACKQSSKIRLRSIPV